LATTNATQQANELVITTGIIDRGQSAAATSNIVEGTWALQQLSPTGWTSAFQDSLDAALTNFDLTGFSVRTPWKDIETGTAGNYNFTLWNTIRSWMNTNHPTKKLMVRFMAGRSTPSFRLGNYWVYDGSCGQGTVDQNQGVGSLIPLAFNKSGFTDSRGWNSAFIDGWKAMVNAVNSWASSNNAGVVHGAWPGLLWSEIAYCGNMLNQEGHSSQVVFDVHVHLLNFLADTTNASRFGELSVSGHVVNNTLFTRVHQALSAHPKKNNFFFSSNNVGFAWDPTKADTAMYQGLPTGNTTFRRGMQMVGLRNDYPWKEVFDMLIGGTKTDRSREFAEYLEIYTPSFTGGTAATLDTFVSQYDPPLTGGAARQWSQAFVEQQWSVAGTGEVPGVSLASKRLSAIATPTTTFTVPAADELFGTVQTFRLA
jgi:hypothetical protein